MRILVIPDIHLKPWVFAAASALMKNQATDRAVCLMDIADDWGQKHDLELYMQTYDAAARFAADFPDTLWRYGNHDLSYLWKRNETVYSPFAEQTVCEKLGKLRKSLPNKQQLAYLHRIDSVLFSHGGLTDAFVRRYVPSQHYNNVDEVISRVNRLGSISMWSDFSPIWYRPSYGERMYKPKKLLQVTDIPR